MRLKLAFKEDVQSADWMVNITKNHALDKLHKMFFAIGEPAKLDDYAGVHLSETEFLKNGEPQIRKSPPSSSSPRHAQSRVQTLTARPSSILGQQ